MKVTYAYTSETPYEDLEDGTPNLHHTPSVRISNNTGIPIEDFLSALAHNSKIGVIRDIEYTII